MFQEKQHLAQCTRAHGVQRTTRYLFYHHWSVWAFTDHTLLTIRIFWYRSAHREKAARFPCSINISRFSFTALLSHFLSPSWNWWKTRHRLKPQTYQIYLLDLRCQRIVFPEHVIFWSQAHFQSWSLSYYNRSCKSSDPLKPKSSLPKIRNKHQAATCVFSLQRFA